MISRVNMHKSLTHKILICGWKMHFNLLRHVNAIDNFLIIHFVFNYLQDQKEMTGRKEIEVKKVTLDQWDFQDRWDSEVQISKFSSKIDLKFYLHHFELLK